MNFNYVIPLQRTALFMTQYRVIHNGLKNFGLFILESLLDLIKIISPMDSFPSKRYLVQLNFYEILSKLPSEYIFCREIRAKSK